jgi:hypothetical protein
VDYQSKSDCQEWCPPFPQCQGRWQGFLLWPFGCR